MATIPTASAASHAARPCAGCGYDLRGQPGGGRCPECGQAIIVPKTLDDPLSIMPVSLIRPLVVASWLASACFAGVVLIVLLGAMLDLRPLTQSALLMAIAVTWCIAAWILTRPMTAPSAVSRGWGGRSVLRRSARWLQIGWLFAALCLFAWNWISRAIVLAKLAAPAVVFGPPQQAGAGAKQVFGQAWLPAIEVSGWAGVVTGLAGLVMLTLLLQRLAEWVRDDSAERAFERSLWGTPIATLLLLIDLPILLVGLVIGLFWMLCVLCFPYGLFSLSRSLTWSIRHSHEYQDRLRRQRERQDKQAAEIAQTVAKMDAARGSRHEGTEARRHEGTEARRHEGTKGRTELP